MEDRFELKWIKLWVNLFDNPKIKHLRRLPRGNDIVLLWIILLTLAEKCNDGGRIYITENVPYSAADLAANYNLREVFVVRAMAELARLNMITTDPIAITNWSVYQSIDDSNLRRSNRERQARYRARLKAATHDNVTSNVICNGCHAAEEKTTEEETEGDRDEEIEGVSGSLIDEFLAAWNNLGLTPVSRLTDKRRKLLYALIAEYGIEDVLRGIENIKDSAFLRGQSSGFMISIDWFLQPDNYIKVLEGNYNDRKPAATTSTEQTKATPAPGKESSVDRMARLMSEGVFRATPHNSQELSGRCP